MKLEKKHWTIIGVIILAIVAFFTRKYWLPAYGKINIKGVDWDNKTVDYSLFLQGNNQSNKKAVFGKDDNAFPRWSINGKTFTFTVNSDKDEQAGDFLLMTLYKGSLEGVNTNEYESITLDRKLIFFDKKTIVNKEDIK